MRYGATDYVVYRNRDDMYKFMQCATFEYKAEFEAYWYGPEMTAFKTIHSGWYQVPILYTWADVVIAGGARNGVTQRRCVLSRTSSASGPAPCGAGPAAWPGSSRPRPRRSPRGRARSIAATKPASSCSASSST